MSLIIRSAVVKSVKFAGVALFGMASVAVAGVTAEDKCEATKLKETGKLASCVMSSLAKTTKAGVDPNQTALDACDTKFAGKLASAETKAEGACPTTGDAAALQDMVAALSDNVKGAVNGLRFVDNGDGTVTDTEQGVVWQKQTAGGSSPSGIDQLHTPADILGHLGALNGTATVEGLGERDDWGLPTLAQLQSILDCSSPPCVFKSPLLGPNPLPASGGSTYMMTGETGFIPLSSTPCLKLIAMETGTVDCKDFPSAEGRSKVRTTNNCR